jgi:hypothetical protein
MNSAEEDLDLKLQKISSDLIADLDHALARHIRKPDGSGGTRVRTYVRAREMFAATCNVSVRINVRL